MNRSVKIFVILCVLCAVALNSASPVPSPNPFFGGVGIGGGIIPVGVGVGFGGLYGGYPYPGSYYGGYPYGYGYRRRYHPHIVSPIAVVAG